MQQQPNNNPPSHAHSWHNLRFATNGQPRGQSMMQLNQGSSSSSAAVANAFASAEGGSTNSSWDPVPIGGRGLTSLLQNNPLFSGMGSAMIQRTRTVNTTSSQGQQQQQQQQQQIPPFHNNGFGHQQDNGGSNDSFQQQQAKRQKTVSFATLTSATQQQQPARLDQQQQSSSQGNFLFPTQQQQRSLAHAAQSTPNFSSNAQHQSNHNPFLNAMQTGSGNMQNASFQMPAPSSRPNPFLAQLQQGNTTLRHQQQSSTASNITTTANNHATAHQFASIFDDAKPSPLAMMRQQQQQARGNAPSSLQQSLEPSRKRPAPSGSSFKYGYASTFAKESASNPKLMFASIDGSSLLHNSCKLYPETSAVVESAIAMDPEAVRRPISIVCCMKGVGDGATTTAAAAADPGVDGSAHAHIASTGATTNNNNNDKQKSRKQRAQERFHYPLNIALKYNACYEILSMLAVAGPDVIALPDGPDRCTALATAIALERDARVIELLLETNPQAAEVCDRQSNTPLHAAMRISKPSLQVVELVFRANPKALHEHNFHGETPLDMAVRNNSCSEQVLDFFQQHRDGDLEENLQDDLV